MNLKLMFLITIFSLVSCAHNTTEYTKKKDGTFEYKTARTSLLRQGEARSITKTDDFCNDTITLDKEASGNAVALGGIAGLALGGPVGGLVGGGIPAVVDAMSDEEEVPETEDKVEVTQITNNPCANFDVSPQPEENN